MKRHIEKQWKNSIIIEANKAFIKTKSEFTDLVWNFDNELVYVDGSQLGSVTNPYIMDAEMLKDKIENIDMSDGYVINQAG